MNKIKRRLFIFSLTLFHFNVVNGDVEKPENWSVQYIDDSCIVNTSANGAGGESPSHIKMGYMSGNQLIFMFSVSNDALKNVELPESMKAKLTAQGENYETIGPVIRQGELIIPVKNSFDLQASLKSSGDIGIKIFQPGKESQAAKLKYRLKNISGAIDWLDACNKLGARAIPQ